MAHHMNSLRFMSDFTKVRVGSDQPDARGTKALPAGTAPHKAAAAHEAQVGQRPRDPLALITQTDTVF